MTNLMKSAEKISFGVSFEEYIREPALLYQLHDEDDTVIRCSDKHVIFYVSDDQPRHFRRRFVGAHYALVIHVELCHYLLNKDAFVLVEHVKQFDDMSNVKAVLHFSPPPLDHKRMYIDQDTFEYLFGVSTHRVLDYRGCMVILDYHDDSCIGRPFKVQVNQKRSRLSARDLYIADKFKHLPPIFAAVYEGRGWISIIADAC